MIDTIALMVNSKLFVNFSKDGFFRQTVLSGNKSFTKYVRNPSEKEKAQFSYLPRLTLLSRGNEEMVKIEFSAPKLVFNNNFDELEENDFGLVVSTLHQKLKSIGYGIFSHFLAEAPVSLIHYSKNIPLTDGSTPYMYLKEIQKANITQRLDFNQTDFRNEGHSLKFRTNSFEVAFYDKMKDLERAKISEKRAVEEDNYVQMDLFEEIKEYKKRSQKRLEILRMEVRLNQRQKIRQILNKINLKTEPTFQNLFSKEIAKSVLLNQLRQIEDNYPKLLLFKPNSAKDFIAQFIIDNPKVKIKDSFTAYGFHKAIDEIGTREARELIKQHKRESWYRFFRQMNNYNYPKNALPVFEPIRNSISEMKPIKLVDIENKMLNNDKYDQQD